jgi:hypothetical protein
VPFVATAVAQAMRWYDPEKIGASRMAIGNAIRLMSRAKKSREGDHFAAAVGLRSMLEGSFRQFPTGPTICTHSPGKSWGAVSITSAKRARSWYRRRQVMIPTRTKPTGCGRSSSGAMC